MRLPGEARIDSRLKGGDNERVEFIAIRVMRTHYFPCAPAKLIGRNIPFEVALEQVHYQLPLEVISTA
jgi:hypothetical protein